MFALQRALRKVRPAWLHIGGPLARRRDALVLVLGGPPRGVRLRGRERAVCDRPEHAVRQLDDAVRRRRRAGIVQRRKLPAAIHRIGLVSRLDSGALRPGHAGADRAVALSDRSVARRPAAAPLRSADLREERLRPRAAPPTVAALAGVGAGPLWTISKGAADRVGPAVAGVRLSVGQRSRAAGAGGNPALAGCPAVGVPRGAPWILGGQTGFQVRAFDLPSLCGAIEQAMRLDRETVRAAALERFDADATVQTVLRALDAARADVTSRKTAGTLRARGAGLLILHNPSRIHYRDYIFSYSTSRMPAATSAWLLSKSRSSFSCNSRLRFIWPTAWTALDGQRPPVPTRL